MQIYANIYKYMHIYIYIYANICKYMQICANMCKYTQTYVNICNHVKSIYIYIYVCKYKIYSNFCKYMQIYVRCPNLFFPEWLWRFEFRILNSLKNYLGGWNFELRIRARFICRLFGFRINFERNYDRTFVLFQGVMPFVRLLAKVRIFCEPEKASS